MFYLYRPLFGDEDEIEDWNYNGRWWYTLTHVCRRWRNVVLGSATYLGLSLLCTYGTPVADMLELSPPLPLLVGYFKNNRELTTEDAEGIILALKQHGRVRRIRLHNVIPIMQQLSLVMDEEYPILELLYITRPTEDNSTILRFPESLQAPHLRHLSLGGFALPIGSRLLTAAVGLVTLHLVMVNTSTYFHPNTLIQWISLMPQLETLIIRFEFPNRDVEGQLTHTPIIAPITLPNLLHFRFQGVNADLEALVHRITAPRLEQLNINFFSEPTFFTPHLLQFIAKAKNLRPGETALSLYDKFASAGVFPNGGTDVYSYSVGIVIKCCHLDLQISSMTQISNSLSQIFSAVERLVLQHEVHSSSSEEHNAVDDTEWRELLRPFSKVKTIRIQRGLVEDISRCLELEDGEPPLELLPELNELEYFGSDDTGDAFSSFINVRRDAGRPVTLVRL